MRRRGLLVPLVVKVAGVHGDHEPRLRELQTEFFEMHELLDLHLNREEQTLCRKVVTEPPEPLRDELACIREEHRQVGAALHRIRALLACRNTLWRRLRAYGTKASGAPAR